MTPPSAASSEPLRVALVGPGMIPIPPPDYGAVEKYIWNLSKALPSHGVEPVIVNEVVGPNGVDEYRWALRARGMLQDLDVDLVHVHSTGVGATFALLGPGYVYTSHSRHWLRDGGGLRDRFGRFMDARALRGATAAIALNPDMADTIQRATGVDPTVVPTGVDVDAYGPDWSARDGSTVVALGVVAPVKRTHLAAEAVEGMADVELVVVGPVGDEAYADRFRAQANVRFTGPVDEEELKRILATGDVFVHPSVTEGLSMAVLEAMASGLPLVASDICVGQIEDGENGVAVPVALPDEERVERMRAALARILAEGDVRRRYGERSRELAVSRYAWDAVAERTSAVYQDALRGS